MIGSRDEEELDRHFGLVTRLLVESRVVPFLGAGANLCGRPAPVAWQEGSTYLPSGAELSAYLKRNWADCTETELTRVAQWVSEMGGSGDLFNSLHELFDRDYPPTALHRFLAALPGLLAGRSSALQHQLIVTTNYDDLLEQAFAAAGQPFDLVTYVSDGPARGKFRHTPPEGDSRLIDIPNQYRDVSPERQTVILKIHAVPVA